MKQKLLPVFFVLLVLASCRKNDVSAPDESNLPAKYKPDVAGRWLQLQLEMIKNTPGFTPPVASRSLAYTGLAIYQSVQPGMAGYKNLNEMLGSRIDLPFYSVGTDNDWALTVNSVCYNLLKYLFTNATPADQYKAQTLYVTIKQERAATWPEAAARAEKYGFDLAKVIYEWSKTDGADQCQFNNFPASYVLPAGPGSWVPTSAQLIPLQPYWGNNRLFCTDNSAVTCMPVTPIPFSATSGSAFHQEAMAVYNTSLSLTPQQRDIALYWADGGGTYTPPGHLINIAIILAQQKNYNLAQAAELYAKAGMAAADAFILCWKGKYIHNLMRPVTYIKNYIQPSWEPLIATPPFPTYGSGHSTVSGAVSEVLKSAFGNSVSFTDNTNAAFGLGTKNITNLDDMAAEAAVSRLYGGIHFPMDNNNALTAGRNIGRNVAAMNFRK